MMMVKTIMADIPSSHESLITWAYNHSYSPVSSYTKAPVANRFHLRLEDAGKEADWLVSNAAVFLILSGSLLFLKLFGKSRLGVLYKRGIFARFPLGNAKRNVILMECRC